MRYICGVDMIVLSCAVTHVKAFGADSQGRGFRVTMSADITICSKCLDQSEQIVISADIVTLKPLPWLSAPNALMPN
jgi:hypothetical protein